jgi:hypothetical protein
VCAFDPIDQLTPCARTPARAIGINSCNDDLQSGETLHHRRPPGIAKGSQDAQQPSISEHWHCSEIGDKEQLRRSASCSFRFRGKPAGAQDDAGACLDADGHIRGRPRHDARPLPFQDLGGLALSRALEHYRCE